MFLRIKPCFYQNIEEEIPSPYQQLVRRVYTLWMSGCLFTCTSTQPCILSFSRLSSPHLPSSLLCSVFRHPVSKCDWVYCLVGWWRIWHKLWLLPAVARTLQSLQLHLLVQTTLQSFQVSYHLLNLTSHIWNSTEMHVAQRNEVTKISFERKLFQFHNELTTHPVGTQV